ncbi:prolipoprotein diacylglyceryl transferase [Alphaproteobacteria bacterium]|nr:prolipoprotein diacylglyceryl transferase [Alphaproteobacteria bacterium]
MVCNFSNVAFSIFGFPVHWYSLAYIFGILFSVYLTNRLAKDLYADLTKDLIDTFINYAIIGIVVGGRLGHVLFYDFQYYSEHLEEILKIWKGGMSFFGGCIGTVLMAYLFCRKHKLIFLKFMDLWAVGAPIGLFLGRIANFANGELLGTASNVPWAVVFNDGISRHPSQIYEAILEGIALFVVMIMSVHQRDVGSDNASLSSESYVSTNFNTEAASETETDRGRLCDRSGVLCGIFCSGYGVARFVGEFFREPDSTFGYELFFKTGMNLNQYMSICIFIFGILLIYKVRNNHERA